ncbi:unnamed protein product [Durusdinium trenchii]|eukprot:g14093.t1
MHWLWLIFLSLLLSSFVSKASDEVDPNDEDEDEDDFPESVHALTESTFDSFLKDKRVLVEFYAPWCGHCQKLEPEYNQAADTLRMEGAKTELAKVDATAETALAEKYQVKSYPTLKYFVNGGEPVDYEGGRDASSIAEWLRKREKPAVEELSDSQVDDFIEKSLKSGAFAVVAHVKKKSARAKALYKAAEALVDYKASKLRLAAVWLPKTADPKKDATMAMSRPEMEPQKLDFTGTWTDGAIRKWVKQSTYALVGSGFKVEKYGTEALEAVGAKGSVVGIYSEEDATKVKELLTKTASKESQWRFTALARGAVEDQDVLGVRGDSSMISVLHGDKKYVLRENLSAEAVEKLLGEILAKKARPYYKSATRTEELEDGVTVLTGDTFEEVVMNSKKDVFVEFYAPWCGHCKKLAPVWSDLAKKAEKEGFAKKGVVIAKMDVTENECEEQISGYPTLVLYPAVKKEKKMRQKLIYSGARDFDPLMDFLVENSVNLEGVEMAGSVGKQASLVERERARAKKAKKEL